MLDTLQIPALVPEVQSFSILELLSQAGGFQWPILIVLVAGLIVLMQSMVQLFQDHLAARPLIRLHLESNSIRTLVDLQRTASSNLYTRLLSRMLEFQHSPGAMGREISEVASTAHTALSEDPANYCLLLKYRGWTRASWHLGRDLHTVFYGYSG